MKYLFKVMAILALVIGIASCDLLGGDEETDNTQGNGNGIDYTSYNTNAAILVRNNTNQKLVAFKGSLSESTKLGGIPAHAQGHGLKNEPALFNKTEDFPMILLTEEQYVNNKTNLKGLENTPFTRVYVFFNKTGENTNIYDISDRLGGIYKLTVQNPSNLNVELRLGGVNGETIGYAPSGMLTTTLYVNEGDFNIFPVFKRYNQLRDIVETVYPKGGTGYPWFQPLGFEDVDGSRDQTFNIRNALGTLKNRTSGVAWLAINNQTAGAVHLMKGNTVVRTSTGVSYFGNGSKTFQIDMPTVSGSSSFAGEVTVSYNVGPDGFEVPIKSVEGSSSLTLKADKMYTVTVTGDHNSTEGLTATVELRETEGLTGKPTPIEFDDFNMQ